MNEFPPEWVEWLPPRGPSPLVKIDGEAPVGAIVFKMAAIDKDGGRDGEVTYAIDSVRVVPLGIDLTSHFGVDDDGHVSVRNF